MKYTPAGQQPRARYALGRLPPGGRPLVAHNCGTSDAAILPGGLKAAAVPGGRLALGPTPTAA